MQQGRAPRKNAALRRLHPPSGAAAFQGVIGESKEGLGGNRNPPGPPWPPEAATRLLSQPYAAQGCAAQPARQRQNAKQHIYPLKQGRAPRKNAALRRLHPVKTFQKADSRPECKRIRGVSLLPNVIIAGAHRTKTLPRACKEASRRTAEGLTAQRDAVPSASVDKLQRYVGVRGVRLEAAA